MFGGNSNWRGPVWIPMNVLLIRALLQFHGYYGDSFQRRMSDRLRPDDDALRGGEGDLRPAAEHFPAAMRTAAARCSAARRSSSRIRCGATTCRSTSISTATTAPASAPATRPAGRRSSPSWRRCSAPSTRAPSERQEGGVRAASGEGAISMLVKTLDRVCASSRLRWRCTPAVSPRY